MRTKKEILKYIDTQRGYFGYHTSQTKLRNNIRLLQWVLGIRTRPYPEGEGLMQKEDAKALEKEKLLRKKLKVKKIDA